MPRLPITIKRIGVAWYAATCIIASVHGAEAAMDVRGAEDLSSDKNVAAKAEKFQMLSKANVVYLHCGEQYGIPPEEHQGQKEFFNQSLAEYLEAFRTAYLMRVGVEANVSTMNHYTKYIYQQEAAFMNNMAAYIQKEKCGNIDVKNVIHYVRKLEYEKNHPTPTTTPGSH